MVKGDRLKSNDCWRVSFCEKSGALLRLQEVTTGIEYVYHASEVESAIGEGGVLRPNALEVLVKCGNSPDHNTGVLSDFAHIHRAHRSLIETPNGMVIQADHGGFRLEISYELPLGCAPLTVRAKLTNQQGQPDAFQMEGVYRWSIPASEWSHTAYCVPGLMTRSLMPFGELYFRAGEGADPAAFWWTPGTTSGVALRAVKGVARFFVGVQAPGFFLGPHGFSRRLMPGETEEMVFEVAPLRQVLEQPEFSNFAAAEQTLRSEQQKRADLSVRIGGVQTWCRHEPPAIPRRLIHLTAHYSPVKPDDVLRLLETVVMPAGFNEVIFEVGRNFRYVSHPKVAPAWGWEARMWKDLVRRVKAMGLRVIPAYNALGHQGESGLARAYPDLAEDPGGWCLNPEHPLTAKYLGDLMGELIDVFEPHVFHVGLDEIDIPSRPQTFALPKGNGPRDGGKLFALHVNQLHAFLKARGLEMMMWADMLLYKPEHQTMNGVRSGTWRAIDQIPRDIWMGDWVYQVVPDFGGSRYLREKGFRVMGATWHTPRNIRDWANFAKQQALAGMIHTTWTVPRIQDINMVCTLLAGKYFQNPAAPPVSDTEPEAEALALSLARPVTRSAS